MIVVFILVLFAFRLKLTPTCATQHWINRKLSASTSENVENKEAETEKEKPPQGEKILKADVENLKKEMEGLTEKVHEFEVSI